MAKGQNMKKYILISKIHNKEQSIKFYGIALVDKKAKTYLEKYEDLSTERKKISLLVKKCNKLKLSRCHFKDVAEDFLHKNDKFM